MTPLPATRFGLSDQRLSVEVGQGRASGGHPSLRPPVVHRARTAESLSRALSGELRDRPAPLPPAADDGRRRSPLANSPRQVQRAFDEVGETSFSAFVSEVRLRNAAELLARQPLTVRPVALLVGYRQPAHFAKAFRRRFGVTPAQYRDRCLARRAAVTTNDDGGRRE